MVKKHLMILIVLFTTLLFFNYAFSEDLTHALPTVNDLRNLGLFDVKMTKDYSSRSMMFQRIFAASCKGKESPRLGINVKLYSLTTTSSIESRYKSFINQGYKCSKGMDWLSCSKVDTINEYGSDYLFRGNYYFIKILDYDKCDASSCYKDSYDEKMRVLNLFIGSVYNFTNPINSIKEPLKNLILSRLTNNEASKKPSIEIISPKDKTTFYYTPGKDFSFDIKVKASGDYVGADYSANGVIIGGKINVNNGIGTINIHLKSDEIFNVATVSAYSRNGANRVSRSITIYFKPKSRSISSPLSNDRQANQNNIKKKNSNLNKNSERNLNKNKQTSTKITLPKSVLRDLNEVQYITKEHKDEIEITKKRLVNLKKKMNADTIETSYSSIKLIQRDEDIIDKNNKHLKVSPNSGLWFEIKYGINKRLLDPIVDKVSDNIPVLGKLKEYFKSDKDTNLFNPDEEAKKTAKDLNIDMKSARLYNQFSGIEDREKALSVAKNSINLPSVAKPFEFALNAMTAGTKKIIAGYYRKEYKYVVGLAKYYRERGMKWKDVHRAVINELDENKGGMRGLGSGVESTASQYLNTMSKGEYKDIDARAHLYILQAMENGELK